MAINLSDAYGYNARGELLTATKRILNGDSEDGVVEYAYAYDDIGNRTSSTEPSGSFTYDANALNQYSSINRTIEQSEQSNNSPEGQSNNSFTPVYDADGNQTCVQTSTGVWTVTYNGENRPVRWQRGTTVLEMTYDRLGRRVEYIERSGETVVKHQKFVYDGYLCIQRLNGLDNSATENFEWDPTEPVATRPVYMQACTPSGNQEFFYTHDGNKNVSELVSFGSSTGVVAHYEYTPFGKVAYANNGSNAQVENLLVRNPWRFSSEYADDASDMVYYTYRHYDPRTGGWLSRDPLGELQLGSPYSFCLNGPLNRSDILGCSILDFVPFLSTIRAAWTNAFGHIPGNSAKDYTSITFEECQCLDQIELNETRCKEKLLNEKYEYVARFAIPAGFARVADWVTTIATWSAYPVVAAAFAVDGLLGTALSLQAAAKIMSGMKEADENNCSCAKYY